MNVSFNLNYLLVFGLAVCIIILIYMLIKHIFVTEKNTNYQIISKKPGEKNLPTNIDFFNKGVKIIEKSDKFIDKENNKYYQIIDLGDKILIMEDTLFFPQDDSITNENEVIKSKPLEVENDSFIPEQVGSDFEKSILTSSDISEIEEMQKAIEESDINFNEVQIDLYSIQVKEAQIVSKDVEEKNETPDDDDDDDDDEDKNFRPSNEYA